MIERAQFAKCLAVLSAGIGKPIPCEVAEIWFGLLKDLSAESLEAAVSRAVLESEYPVIPPLGRIRRLAIEHRDGVPNSAEQAFERVREAVSRFGYPESAKAAAFVGPAVWSVIQGIGGWQRICDSPIDQRQSLFAQFRDGWNRQAETDQRMRRLPEGLRPKGQPDAPPMLPEPHPAIRILADSLDAVSA